MLFVISPEVESNPEIDYEFGVAFNDDAQIVSMSAEKIHVALNESAHIEVTSHELSDYSTSMIIQNRRPNVGGEDRSWRASTRV